MLLKVLFGKKFVLMLILRIELRLIAHKTNVLTVTLYELFTVFIFCTTASKPKLWHLERESNPMVFIES